MEWSFVARGRVVNKEGAPGPFEQARFGSRDRLAWPKGACELFDGRIVYWGKRFAAIVENHVIHVVDARRDDMTKIELRELPIDGAKVATTAKALTLQLADGLLAIPFADLERMVAEDRGDETITVASNYPERRKTATAKAKVVWLMEVEALVNVYGPKVSQVRVPHAAFGLDKGMMITFVDELWPGTYAFIDVPGRPRQVLNRPREGVLGAAVWKREVAHDPAAGATTSLAKLGDRGAALLAQISDRDDLDTRAILIDVLGDAGEACAETFALLGAGKRVPMKAQLAALGPLGHFVKELEFRGGLPWSAELVMEPPLVPEVIEAAAADVRLAMLETFRQGQGPLDIYQKLITSRVLVGLRRVDLRSLAIVRAVRATGYSQLVQVWGLPASSKTIVAMLGDRAFAAVRQVELRIERKNIRNRLAALPGELAALPEAPRHFVLVAEHSFEDEVAAALFPRFTSLRCASLTIAGVTMVRGDKEVQTTAGALETVARIARKTLAAM